MADDAGGVGYHYDGSSTESEPFDDVELEASLPSPAAPSPSAIPAGQAPSQEIAASNLPRSPPGASHNVLDLFALPSLVPPSSFPSPTVQGAQEAAAVEPIPPDQATPFVAIKNSVDLTAAEGTVEASTTAYDAATKCGKCRKLMLSEVARLTLHLASQEVLLCHCCGLTLPWFCFTGPQREARRPECRSCRGVPSVIGVLTTRVKNLLDEQHGGPGTASTAHAAAASPSSGGGEHQQNQGSAAGPADAPVLFSPAAQSPHASTVTIATPASSTAVSAPEICLRCILPLERLTAAHLQLPTKLRCSCCERELPGLFYSYAQRGKKGNRRCLGCIGKVGAPSAARVTAGLRAWQAQHSVKKKMHKKLANLQRALSEARKSEDAEQIKLIEKRLGKWTRRVEKNQERAAAKEKELEETAEFRSRVAQYKAALLALHRRRYANDLRGSTRTDHMDELGNEKAALKLLAQSLKQENSDLFDELMGPQVKRTPREKAKKKRSRSSRSDAFDGGESMGDSGAHIDEDGSTVEDAALAQKRPRTNGLAVSTRAQRRAAAAVATVTATQSVVD